MATKLAEKCTIMLDVGQGMMASVSLLSRNLASPGGRPHSLQNPEWAKLRKTIEKKFPEVNQTELSQMPAFETFQSAAGRIIDELEPIYLTFLDVQEFNDTCLELLKSLPTAIMQLNLTQTPQLSRDFVNLLTLYVQLHVFWSFVEERKVLLALYSCAYQCVHGRTEKNYASLSGQVDSFNEPLKQAIEEFKDTQFQQVLGDVLNQFLPVLMTAFDTDGLRLKNVLDPIGEGDGMPLPVVLPISSLSHSNGNSPNLLHPELLYVDEYCTAIIYAGLVCPNLLGREDFLGLFKMVASDCLVVPVFRSHVLNVHTELETLGGFFPPRSWAGPALPKGVNLKKIFKDLSKDATTLAGLKHRERRSYLRGEMSTLVQLFNQLPGLLAPKFPMVMTALKMAKTEILWHFRHVDQPTVKSRMKHYTSDDYEDPHLSILLGLHDSLLQLVYRNGKIVQNYYIEYMKGAHLTVLNESLTALEGQKAAFSLGVQEILGSIEPTISALSVNESSFDLEGFRLDWYRATANLCAFGSNALKIDAVKNLISRMIRVVEHSRYVDALRGTLESRCELHEVWWFKDSFLEEYNNCLNNPASSLYATSFVRCLRVMAERNAHAFCPEEQQPIGQEAAMIADNMLEKLADRVGNLITPLTAIVQKHEEQVSAQEAARRIERQQAAKAQRRGLKSSETVPGSESQLSSAGREGLRDMITLERNIARLLWGVGEAEEVAVFDRILRPKEYVRAQLISHFVDFTKSMFDDSRDAGVVVPPSEALKRLQYCTAAMQKCSSHLDIEFSSLLRESLFEQSCENDVYDVSKVLKAISGVEDAGDRNVHKVVKMYINLIEQSGNSECLYSMATDSFIRNPDPAIKRKKGSLGPVGLETYATPSELQSLVLMVGTQGARILESALLALISTHVNKIKGILSMNEGSLNQLSSDVTNEAALNSVKNCSELIKSSIIVGNSLSLRKMLHSATGATQKNTVPLINSALNLAAASISHDEVGGGMTPSVISLAKSSGVDVGGLDPSLRESLAYLVSDSDRNLWALLPYAYAASFVMGENWKTSKYISAADVMSGGEQVVMNCISSLCGALLGFEAGKTASEEFLRASSSILFVMKAEEAGKYSQFPIRAMFVLLERFVEVSPFVNRSVLEKYMPYTILHAAYVDMSLNKQRVADVGMDSKLAFVPKVVADA
ncbi:hypothetical protein TL16_g05065 [Triparma laevis f. inornata]|uniref:Uncharacterized protein n=1 Tax=Triparma laevis f. inornata TaxID=1714386 RepID=A0A9W7AH25_9STRA|nr:hypothetical protein TL16_g05065 [Triparma laevis f. inornata]